MVIVTFCGSAGSRSANRAVLDAAGRSLAERGAEVDDATGWEEVPMFRPEQVDDPPTAVGRLQRRFEAADGVAVAVPEYGGGAAGWAKNVLDWMVGSGSLYQRPVVVASAGTTGGAHAIEQIARTLTWQGALVVATVGVAAPRTLSDQEGRLVDRPTLDRIDRAAGRLVEAIADPDRAAGLRAEALAPLGIDPDDRRT